MWGELLALAVAVGVVGLGMLALFLYGTRGRKRRSREEPDAATHRLMRLVDQMLGAVESLPFPAHAAHLNHPDGSALCGACIREQAAWNEVRKLALAVRERTCPCAPGACGGRLCVRCDCLHGPPVPYMGSDDSVAAAGEPPPMVYGLAEAKDDAQAALQVIRATVRELEEGLGRCTCGVGEELLAGLDGRGRA